MKNGVYHISIGVHIGGAVTGIQASTSEVPKFFMYGEAIDVAESLAQRCDYEHILVSAVLSKKMNSVKGALTSFDTEVCVDMFVCHTTATRFHR